MAQAEIEKMAFSVPEVCKAIGLSRTGLYELWNNGDGPKRIRIGRRVLVSKAELVRWLESKAEQL